MADRVVGIHFQGPDLNETVSQIGRADTAGVASAWLTSGGFGPDSLTTLAVAAAQTEQIQLGTSIAVTFSRHPIAMIQQAVAIDQVAPGRFRLGIGTSHRPTIENTYGLPFDRPLEHLREYSAVLAQAFHGGKIDFTGKRFNVHGNVLYPPPIPVYVSALRPASYELAGEIADGAIAWVSPSAYLRDVAKPALVAGAAKRGPNARPRLVGHAFGLVSDDEAAVKKLGRERLASYARMTFYQEMFAAAGHPEARTGVIGDDLVDDLVLAGTEEKVRQGIARFLDAGCEELIITLIPTGPDPDGSIDRTFQFLGQANF